MLKILMKKAGKENYMLVLNEADRILGIAKSTEEGYEVATLENKPYAPNGEGIDLVRQCFSPFTFPTRDRVVTFFRILAGDTSRGYIPATAAKAA